jgi:hypothetical protein
MANLRVPAQDSPEATLTFLQYHSCQAVIIRSV